MKILFLLIALIFTLLEVYPQGSAYKFSVDGTSDASGITGSITNYYIFSNTNAHKAFE
jgi:hypothetical protein